MAEHLKGQGLIERPAQAVIPMSASAPHHVPRPNRNIETAPADCGANATKEALRRTDDLPEAATERSAIERQTVRHQYQHAELQVCRRKRVLLRAASTVASAERSQPSLIDRLHV